MCIGGLRSEKIQVELLLLSGGAIRQAATAYCAVRNMSRTVALQTQTHSAALVLHHFALTLSNRSLSYEGIFYRGSSPELRI